VTDVLLDRFHALPDGRRVRLRLARSLDRGGLARLLSTLGLEAGDFELRRALRCTPGRCWAIVATEWDGTVEQLVGLGTLDVAGRSETLLAPDPAVRALLHEALRSRAGGRGRRVA
jgi:hypothetical protein